MTTVASATQTQAASSTKATTKAIEAAQDRFLKLLVTQMQNQDPLNPLDNAQVTSQMAQISTVTGIDKLNDSMSGLSSVLAAARTMQATSMIGHDVFAEGSQLKLTATDSGKQAVGGFILPQDASSVKVEILDAGGAVLQTKVYNDVAAGINHFAWDGARDAGGTADAGTYRFRVTALRGASELDVTQLSVGRVTSVSLAQGEATLSVSGLGNVGLDEIQQVL